LYLIAESEHDDSPVAPLFAAMGWRDPLRRGLQTGQACGAGGWTRRC
jgi:hypothetical protein